MTLERRLTKLEEKTKPGMVYGLVFHVGDEALVCVPGTDETISEEAWRARHPGATFVVKRIIGVSPDAI